MGLTLNVLVNGERSEALSSRFRTLAVIDGIGHELDSATLAVSVPRATEIALPALGVGIAFTVSRDGQPAEALGHSLLATAVTGSTREGVVTIEAGALDPSSPALEQRDASWTGKTVGEIVSAIAERTGLVPAVSAKLADVEPSGAIQSAESDAQFLRRLVARLDGRFMIKGGRAIVLAAGERSAASGAALPALELDVRDDGSWVRYRRADLGVRGSASARYYGDSYSSSIETVTVGEGTPKRRLSSVYRSRAEAVAAAERNLRKGRSSRDWIEIERELTLEARALYPLSVAGAPEGFSDELTIHEVRHSIGGQVARTVIQARPF